MSKKAISVRKARSLAKGAIEETMAELESRLGDVFNQLEAKAGKAARVLCDSEYPLEDDLAAMDRVGDVLSALRIPMAEVLEAESEKWGQEAEKQEKDNAYSIPRELGAWYRELQRAYAAKAALLRRARCTDDLREMVRAEQEAATAGAA